MQVGLIVFLAHVGCWVPASEATVPILDSIFTRIQTVESVAIGVSSFLCDVNQVGVLIVDLISITIYPLRVNKNQ